MSCTFVSRSREQGSLTDIQVASVSAQTLGYSKLFKYISADYERRCDYLKSVTLSAQILGKTYPTKYYSKIVDQVLTDQCKAELRARNIRYKPVFKAVQHTKYHKGSPVEHELTPTVCQDVRTWATPAQGVYTCRMNVSNMAMLTQDANLYLEPSKWFVDEGIYDPNVLHEVTSLDLMRGVARLEPTVENLFDTLLLPNFLFELKDLRRLADLFSTKYKDISAASGDKFLGVNFGVLPVISDIQKMQILTKKIREYADRWNDLAAKEATITLKTTLWNTTSVDDREWESDNNDFHFNFSQEYSQTAIAKLHLYVVPHHISESSILTLLTRAHGFHKPLSVVWEAIPFSWLIDYFVNIGKVIEDMENPEGLLSFNVVDMGYSRLLKRRGASYGELTTGHNDSHSFSFNPVTMAPYYEEHSYYERVPLPPSAYHKLRTQYKGVDLTLTGGPNPHQSLLMAALGAK